MGRNKLLNLKTVLRFVKIALKRRKIPPTVRETADYFNISKSAAHSYLKDLYRSKIIKTRKSQFSNRTVARGLIIKSKNKRTNVRK
ncbi:MAG: hypothetical protein AB1349_12575 [Elusimicrobiota bacterium]